MKTALLKKPIYLDNNSTTPTDPRVMEAMLPYFTEKYGNPHSSNHPYGWEAEEAIEIAREHIATLIGSQPNEIYFTSGATESNNMAIKGAASFFKKFVTEKNHIITAATEHKCVLEACHLLKHKGFDVTFLEVDQDGMINLDHLKEAITDKTFLVSMMMVNNEIGTIHDVHAIGEICREHNIWFHTDAAQAFGKIPINVQDMKIDMLSISGHKIYAPKGIGALYVRNRAPKIRLLPILSGGRQEKGLRPGTV
ncbi:MAG: aminotransferase class V-fold PLP-dependent enzyme, partial [Rickettsiales bacterium]|nr:aminotransferase class V-fold PLP-dependent enzyme [Rickettsiales bacterium]